MAQKSNNIFNLLSDDEEAPAAAKKSNQRTAPAKVKPNVSESVTTGKEKVHQEPKKQPAQMDKHSRTKPRA